MKYRRDIDGLRAVAVGGVVLYHAFPSTLTGGFVGVDIFFVISGYLITSILASEAEAGKFSIAGFYERRFRRILPALAFMLAVTTAAAVVILPPSELAGYGKSLLAVAVFASNILFWGEGGYFDGPAGDKPLLHTWSLAVEEQFYIVWPLIVAALVALGRRRLLKGFVWLAVLVSLVVAEVVVHILPTQAFYLLPYRAWELGFGALLAVGAIPALRYQWQREVGAAVGIALIVAAMLLYTGAMPFPGLSAVPPCLGALLLIHAGQAGETRAGRLLSWRPMVFVGLTSYSFYLWHWPVLVLSPIALNRPLHGIEAALAIMAAFGLAVISLRYVEKPFRGRGTISLTRGGALAMAGAVLATFGAAGAVAWKTQGLAAMASPAVIAAERATKSINPYRARCHDDGRDAVLVDPHACTAGASASTGGYDVLLWGDSHADHLMPGLAALGAERGFSVRQASASAVDGCSPLAILAGGKATGRAGCAAIHAAILAEAVRQPALKVIVISARWSLMLSHEASDDGRRADFAALRKRLAAFVQRTRAAVGPRPRILFVGSTPEFGFWPSRCFARAAKLGSDTAICAHADANDEQASVIADRALSAIAAPGVQIAIVRPVFCGAGTTCRTAIGKTILFRDDNHLTNQGSMLVARHIAGEMPNR